MTVKLRHIGGIVWLMLLFCIVPAVATAAATTYPVRGKVIDKNSRKPVAYANVTVTGLPGKGASTDSLGVFRIEQVPPGIYRFEATCIGYVTASSPEYIVSASTPFIEIVHHHAAVQNGDTIADLLHDAHLVGDDHHRDAKLLVDVLDQLQDGMGGVGVQRAGGLIAQQHLGVRCQRAGNGNALLLTAGQLCRVGIGLIGQTHHFQQLSGTLFGIRLFRTRQLHGEADVLQAGALHQQVELLEDHSDVAAALAQLGRGQALHGSAVNDDAALRGALQQIDAAHQRGFARAGHADDAIDGTIRDGQVNVFQRIHRAVLHLEGLGNVFDLDHRNAPCC